jgi:hypothetical protein
MTSYSLCMPTFRNNLPYKSLGRTDINPVYGGSRFLHNAGNHLPNYTVSHAEDYYVLNIQRSGKLVSYIYIKTPHTTYSWEADSHLSRLATLFYETPGFPTISKPEKSSSHPPNLLQIHFNISLPPTPKSSFTYKLKVKLSLSTPWRLYSSTHWSPSRSSRLNPGAHWTEGCAGSRGQLDVLEFSFTFLTDASLIPIRATCSANHLFLAVWCVGYPPHQYLGASTNRKTPLYGRFAIHYTLLTIPPTLLRITT